MVAVRAEPREREAPSPPKAPGKFSQLLFARTRTSTRVVGVFELRGGKIAAWRDYYDLKSDWLDQVGIDHADFERRLATAEE
jgi:hypothetical protein